MQIDGMRFIGFIVMLAAAVAWAEPSTAPTHYALDPAKSSLKFNFVQAGAKNEGQFKKFPVSFDFAPDGLATSRLDVTVQMSSLDTGDKDRDDTLSGADLFSVAKFPQARFTSTQINKTADGFEAVGKLTIRGTSRDAKIPFAFRTATEQGQPVGYMTGKTTIRRLDFGVGQGDWKSTEWVGNDVIVSYSLRLTPGAR